MKIKVQQIHWCVQCEEMLPKRCVKCVKHPERKPRFVEIYGAPPILDSNPCGCVKIRCQRDGCVKTKWIHPRADGTLGFKNHFCSHSCNAIVTATAKVAKRVTAICSCGCGRSITRPACNMRTKHLYFSQLCHYRHRIAQKAEKRRDGAEDHAAVQTVACYGAPCRGALVDHTRLPNGRYACVRCGNRISEPATRFIAASTVTD